MQSQSITQDEYLHRLFIVSILTPIDHVKAPLQGRREVKLSGVDTPKQAQPHHEMKDILLAWVLLLMQYTSNISEGCEESLQKWMEVELNFKNSLMQVLPHNKNFETLSMLGVLLLVQESITCL